MYTCTRPHDDKLSNYEHQRTTTGKYKNRVIIKNIGIHEIGLQFTIDNRIDFPDYHNIPRLFIYIDSTLTIHVKGYREYRDDPKIIQLRHSPLPAEYKEYLYSLSLLLYYMYVHGNIEHHNI